MADSYDQFLAAAGTMTRETWPELIDKTIDVFWSQRNEAPQLVLSPFFDVTSGIAGRTHVITSGTSHLGMPKENEDLDPLPYAVAAPGRKQTFTVVNYRNAVRVTDTAFRMDRFDKIMYSVSGLLQSAVRFDEYHRAAILDAAFSGTAGDDSKALCATDHPHENNDAGTWNNLGTGALTGPNLHALILKADKMTDPQNDPMPTGGPYTVVIPPDLRKTIIELTKTDKKPDGALNNVNALLPEVGFVVSPYLSSTTAYYMFGNLMGEERGLHEVQLMDWDLSANSPANVDIKIDRRLKSSKTFGITHSKNLIASSGV
jgi:hypothetical protein